MASPCIATYWLPCDREAFLFLSRYGTHPLRGGFHRSVLRPALVRAGLGDRRITWLSLRHTAATLMFDAGLTILDVQQRLGHHSPVLTQEIYTHLLRERFDEGRKTMEAYIRGVMGEEPPAAERRHNGRGKYCARAASTPAATAGWLPVTAAPGMTQRDEPSASGHEGVPIATVTGESEREGQRAAETQDCRTGEEP